MTKVFSSTGTTVGLSAERTAIATPVSGMQFYETDTSTLYIYTGSAWVALASAAAPPALQLINPTSVAGTGVTNTNGIITASTSSAASVNGVFTTNYDNYRVIWSSSAYSNAGQTQTNIRLRAAGSDNANSNYYWARNYSGATTSGASNVDLGTVWQMGDTNTPLHSFSMDVYSPFLTRRTSFISQTAAWQNATSNFFLINTAGTTSVTTSYDGFTISASTGTLSGELRIYGYRNSI